MHDEGQTTATDRPRGYATWIGPVGTRRLGLARWAFLAAATTAASAAIVAVVLLRVSGIGPALVILVSGLTLMAAYVVVWFEITARAHLALLKRTDLGDYARLAIFVGTFLAFPILTLVMPLALYLTFVP